MSASSAPLPAGDLATPAPRSRPVWARFAATGFLLLALAPGVLVASSLAAGLDLSEDVMFIAPLLVLPLAMAGLVLRFGAWAKVLGAVVSILAALSMFWMAYGLGFPTAFADFTSGAALVVGILAALGGSIASAVAGRRGSTATGLAGAERTAVLAAVGVVVLAGVISSALDLTTNGTVVASDAAVAATMHDFAFEEGTITVAAGAGAEIVVHNTDPFVHDFTVPALGIEPVVLGPGQQTLVTIADAEPGTYTVYCTLHSDTDAPDGGEGGMATTLVVE